MCLVLGIKVQGVEKKFHSGSFRSTFSFWWHPKEWGGFWAGFSSWLQVQESSTWWALQSQWGLTCKFSQNWGLCGQRRTISGTLLFSIPVQKRFLHAWSLMSVSFKETAPAELRICKQVSDLYQSLRSAFLSVESLFPCMESWFATQPLPMRYHHETTLLIERRTFLCYDRLPNMWDSCGHPDHLLFSEHSQNVSPFVTMCNLCQGLLLNPTASWGREERRYKTTAWVIVGDRTGTRHFLGRLLPFASPWAGIISSVLDLSYSHASTHLNAFFFEIVCLGVICVVHFRLLMICCLQWNAHWYAVNHEEMQRHPFVTTDWISLDFWNGLPVKLWEPSLKNSQSFVPL